MFDTPFDVLRCSWPRPAAQSDGRWVSDPEWDAPEMPLRPQPRWESVGGERLWHIDWCEFFRGGLKFWEPHRGGEMRQFHLVFHLRVHQSGTLAFWDDDGSIIRRRGRVVHDDRTSHPPARSQIEVRAGDRLEVAQWQFYGGWTWGARLEPAADPAGDALDLLRPYRDAVRRRLRHPNGPPLKTFFSGQTPLRTAVALYSMILNGYSPSQVLVFGEHQWPEPSRPLFDALLPFAKVVPTDSLLDRVGSLGTPQLPDLARQHFLVAKTCAAVLYPPHEYCLMDDDVFVLEPIEEALTAFRGHDVVFAPDADYGADYLAAWGPPPGLAGPLPTGRLNGGLYCLRHAADLRQLAAAMLRVSPAREPTWQWEQGFLATQFAHAAVTALPAQRYFYPYFDGLPGGPLGYDYARNPCGFVSIHFGGLAEKPADADALVLAPDLLGRRL